MARQRSAFDEDGLVVIEAIGGSLGSVLVGSSLERALSGLVIGLAAGWAVHTLWRHARRAKTAGLLTPAAHPAGLGGERANPMRMRAQWPEPWTYRTTRMRSA